MAEDNKQLTAAGEEAGQVTEKKKGSRLFLLIGMGVFFLSLLAGGWVAYAQYEKLAAAARVMGLMDKAPPKEEEKKTVPLGQGKLTEFKGIIVNPAGTNGERYLLVNIGMETQKDEVLEEISAKEIVIRDAVLRYLSQLTLEQLADIDQRDAIKEDLKNTVNNLLEKGKVDHVYFTQYVIQ